jgi:hypothetical protein
MLDIAAVTFFLAAAAVVGGAFRFFALVLVLVVVTFFAPACVVTGSCRVGAWGCDFGGCCGIYVYCDGVDGNGED